MSDLYHLVTIDDGKKDNDAILKVFGEILAGKLPNDLKLLNYYREVPVSFNASLENVAPDRIELKVHQNQAVVMKHEKHTLIKSDHFPGGHGVHAFVALANIDKGKAILNRFAYAQIRAERRGAVRVQLDEQVDGCFCTEDLSFSGRVKDISITGISLVSSEQVPFETHTEGSFSCSLNGSLLQVSARVVKTLGTDGLYTCICAIDADPKVESLISQFIYAKQVEIVRELKDQLI